MNPCPSPNLSSTLSSLNNLIYLSNQILSLTPSPPTLNTNLIQCLFNPHHRLPPHSLFLHHLRCPSAPRPLPDLTHSLAYPQTLHNPPSDQLSFYLNSLSNFFYRHCPAVVPFSPAHALTQTATLTLPSFLSLQCTHTNATHAPILPSSYFSIARELDYWNDFPNSFSNSVTRAVSALGTADDRQLTDWIIANSPRYGVVIDTAMQCHVFRLCCVCLKSIIKEASVSAESQDSRVDCPVSYQALTWLASQVSILYGAINAKAFVLNFLKKCVMVGASVLLLFPLGNDSSKQESISVPQVAAAVAALHERSLFEQRIKGFWFSQQPSNYQLAAEHSYLSEKANEERTKRLDYEPLIDHDGLHRQQSSNQETSKKKTREELLAEERDYKRRRMSYRGKKANKSQSPLQAMRYMIEDFMEQIKQAGGFESPVKMSKETGLFPPKPPADIPMEANNSRKVNHDSPEVTISNARNYEEQSQTNCCDKSKSVEDDAFSRDHKQRKHEHHRSHYYREDQRDAERGKYHRDRPSTSSERHLSHGRSQEYSSHHNKQDYFSNRKKYDNSSRIRDRWQKDTHRSRNSDSFPKNAFSDRYHPSESLDICEDDISNNKCIKSDKLDDKESY
uniref:CHHC U11-48K-type domain-containing protein n=1 Tax=Cajanus cajan TaxID=3821 RepID=A0A151U5J7_CAJCA|nr:hypothetical protein KK1_007271 [Cajanus cajan]